MKTASSDLASDELASDDIITSGALDFRNTSLQMLQALFLLIHLLSFVLSEPYKIKKKFVYGPAHLNKY